jgi:hypothetical protein
MHGEGMPDHVGNHGGAARPRFNEFPVPPLIHLLDFFEQMRIDKGALTN